MAGARQKQKVALAPTDANGSRPLTAQPKMPDEEEIRRTAYFLWEQDGRPMGQDDHYWWAALEKIARSRSSDALLQNGPEA